MQASNYFTLGSFEVRPDQNLIKGPAGERHVEPKAMAVLLELAAAEGRTVSREALVRAVWPRGFVGDDALSGCVAQLRRALGDDARKPSYIATVPKMGYRLVQSCQRVSPGTDEQSDGGGDFAPVPHDRASARPVPRFHWRHWRMLVAVFAAVGLALVLAFWFPRSRAPADGGNAPTSTSRKGVAVLPFANLSEDQSNAFFASGMQDEILSDLARNPDLKVISRTSVMNYQNHSGRDMRDIARTLGVTYVIEGSVQRIDGRIRVTAQLIDAPHDAHIWAAHYDRKVTDVFAIESEIAQNIADHLFARLSPLERTAIRRAPTSDLKAYALYVKARNIFVWGDPDGAELRMKRKAALLQQAVRRDPDFALAYCALAKVQADLSNFPGYKDHLQAAKNAVDAALRLQPNLADAHRELGRYYFYIGELDRAYDKLLAVSRIWPNDAETFRILGAIDREKNRWEDAVADLRKATELDPRNLEYTFDLQWTYRLMHHYDEGLRFIREAFERDPQHPDLKWIYLAEYRLNEGDLQGVQEALSHLPPGFGPTNMIWLVRFMTALDLRDYDAANRVIAATPRKWAFITFIGNPPNSLEDGMIARLRGDTQKARKIFAAARKALANNHAQYSQGWYLTWAARLDAELGHKEKAVDEAIEAVNLASRQSTSYRRRIRRLALVYTVIGDRNKAMDRLESIATVPAGLNYGDLRFNPQWDPLREEPRFQKLLASLAMRVEKQGSE